MAIGSTLLALAAVILALGLLAARRAADSPLEPYPWDEVPKPPQLHGPLAVNEILENAELLHVDNLIGPEAFALGEEGVIYTGLADGRVVALDANGEHPRDVFFTGGHISAACRAAAAPAGLGECSAELRASCSAAARTRNRGLSEETERRCGRPLGLQYDTASHTLFVLDGYHGLFAVSTGEEGGGEAKHLFDATKQAPEPAGGGDAAHVDARRPTKFLNDIALVSDGTLLVTDSSWKYARFNNRLEILDAAPRGRLLHFDPSSGSLKTLLCGLHFPNGVILARDGDTPGADSAAPVARFAESLRFRILQAPLATLLDPAAAAAALADCSGASLPPHVAVWADGIPGFADNIEESAPVAAPDADAELEDAEVEIKEVEGGAAEGAPAAAPPGVLLVGVGTRGAAPFSLLHFMFWLPPRARTALIALVTIQRIEKLIPRYGLVLQLDAHSGEVQASYHDPTGRVPFVSTALRHPTSGYLFLGSSQNPFLARVRVP